MRTKTAKNEFPAVHIFSSAKFQLAFFLFFFFYINLVPNFTQDKFFGVPSMFHTNLVNEIIILPLKMSCVFFDLKDCYQQW